MGLLSFPDVPFLPGVPSLPRFPSSVPQLANLVGSISGQNMNVSAITGALFSGSALSGTDLINGTRVMSQMSGVTGGIGSYLVDTAQTFAGSVSSIFNPPSFGGIDELLSDDPSVSQGSASDQWGIFDSGGSAVLTGDSVFSVEFAKNRHISDYPVEPNGFASYNKVAVPYDFKIVFTKGGTVDDRTDFLKSVNDVVESLDLYDAVTPEATYTGANAVHYDYSRRANRGATLMQVSVYFEEVRETASATFTNADDSSGTSSQVPAISAPADPTAPSSVDDGPVQAFLPTLAQQAIVLPQSDIVKSLSRAFQ